MKPSLSQVVNFRKKKPDKVFVDGKGNLYGPAAELDLLFNDHLSNTFDDGSLLYWIYLHPTEKDFPLTELRFTVGKYLKPTSLSSLNQ